jgi:anti-repressor protein
MPTQKSMDLKLFEIKERTIVTADSATRITKTPKITGKGQNYFTRLFLSEKAA